MEMHACGKNELRECTIGLSDNDGPSMEAQFIADEIFMRESHGVHSRESFNASGGCTMCSRRFAMHPGNDRCAPPEEGGKFFILHRFHQIHLRIPDRTLADARDLQAASRTCRSDATAHSKDNSRRMCDMIMEAIRNGGVLYVDEKKAMRLRRLLGSHSPRTCEAKASSIVYAIKRRMSMLLAKKTIKTSPRRADNEKELGRIKLKKRSVFAIAARVVTGISVRSGWKDSRNRIHSIIVCMLTCAGEWNTMLWRLDAMEAGGMDMSEAKKLGRLFGTFLKIGAFTFGGGYAMIPLIQREAVERNGWISEEDILEIVAIAESTPGPIAINSATFVGYRVAGVWGAVCATLGVVLPSFLTILLVSRVLREFQSIPAVQYAFFGIRAGVLALIVKALWTMYRKCPKSALAYGVAAGAFVCAGILNVNVLLVILGCGAFGLGSALWAARRDVR